MLLSARVPAGSQEILTKKPCQLAVIDELLQLGFTDPHLQINETICYTDANLLLYTLHHFEGGLYMMHLPCKETAE